MCKFLLRLKILYMLTSIGGVICFPLSLFITIRDEGIVCMGGAVCRFAACFDIVQ